MMWKPPKFAESLPDENEGNELCKDSDEEEDYMSDAFLSKW